MADFTRTEIIKIMNNRDGGRLPGFQGVDLSYIDLSGLTISGNFGRANLRGANFTKTELFHVSMNEANLEGANFTNARWSRWEILWLNYSNLQDAILFGADLGGNAFNRTYLNGANLSGADLRYAILTFAKIENAVLRNTNLSGAILDHANFKNAILEGANFEGTQLDDVKMPDGDTYKPKGFFKNRIDLSRYRAIGTPK